MLFVGVFCGSDLFTGVCACVLYIVLPYVHITFLYSACQSTGCTCVICCV